MSLLQRISGRVRRLLHGLPRNFVLDKKDLIDHVFTKCTPQPKSFADLGGVWGVHGAYTFYALEAHKPARAVLVDTDFTDPCVTRAKGFPALTLLPGNFGRPEIAEAVGEVDAVFMFDILLHQVKPGWDALLELYASRTRYFVIFNQQWTGPGRAVRLLDLGREEYFKNVPHSPNEPLYKDLFDRLDTIHPQHQRPWRDVHNIWQWGITDEDLVEKMQALGFEKVYYAKCGRFGSLPNIENHAFVFRRA